MLNLNVHWLQVHVTRTATASPPVEGTFDISFSDGSHGSLSGLPANISSDDLSIQLQTLSGITTASVVRTGDCYGWESINFVITFLSFVALQVADPGGSLEQLSPQTAMALRYNGAPLIRMCSIFVPIEVETKTKILLTKQCFTLRWTSGCTWRTLTQALTD